MNKWDNTITFSNSSSLLSNTISFIRNIRIFFKKKIYSYLLNHIGKDVYIHPSVTLNWPENIFLGNSVKLYKGVILNARTTKKKGLYIDDGVKIHEFTYVDPYGGYIKLEKNVGIGHHCVIGGHGGLTVGEYSMISGMTYIVPANHITTDKTIPYLLQGETKKGIKIGRNVWIGANCIITDGIIIGDNTIIGAGSVVTKSIPQNCLAVGVPARVIKTF